MRVNLRQRQKMNYLKVSVVLGLVLAFYSEQKMYIEIINMLTNAVLIGKLRIYSPLQINRKDSLSFVLYAIYGLNV